MASIAIGNSITPTGTGANDGKPDPSQVRTLELTNGGKPTDSVVPCAANATTTLWQASTHGVSGTTAAADIVFVSVDPPQTEGTSLSVDLIPTYTTVSSTSTTAQATYPVAKREHGLIPFPGEGRDSSGVQRFLTKIEVKNRNTGTDDAVNVRVQVWA